jgi:hypothetical protein
MVDFPAHGKDVNLKVLYFIYEKDKRNIARLKNFFWKDSYDHLDI